MLPAPVQQAIDALVAEGGRGRPVVFDADGTLWRGDVGEDLLRLLGQRRLLGAASDGVFARYEQLLKRDPSAAYAFAVEVLAGFAEAELQRVCDDFFAERYAGRVFRFVRPLLARLTHAGLTPWICSASPRWAVLPGARALGIEPAHVIGVTCAVEDGVLTGRVDQPVTCGPGKVTWLERHGVQPVLAFGNGDLDVDMLAAAARAVVVAPLDGPDNALVAEAKRRGWPVLRA
ncbi:MAG: HAD family hydrolase [Myxococcota bacterium]|jgi:phosphoserine phosphatase